MKKTISVKTKLIGTILPVILVGFVILTFVAYSSSKKSITEKSEALLRVEGEAASNELIAWKEDNITTLNTVVNTMQDLEHTDEEVLEYENFYLGTQEDYPNGIYIIQTDGDLLDASGWEPDEDLTEKGYFKEGLEHTSGTFEFGEPYVDDLTGDMVVTATRRMDNIAGEEAVACCDINLTILNTLVADMDVDGNGDAFIIDTASGTVLADAKGEYAGQAVSDTGDKVFEKVLELANDESQVASIGKHVVAIVPVEGTSWVICTRALESAILKDVHSLSQLLLILGAVIIVAVTIILLLNIRTVTGPINKLTNSIVAVTNGDFTTDIEVKGNDEVTVMAGNTKKFLEVMRAALGSIDEVAENIDNQAKGSTEIAGTLHESASGQSDAMGQLRMNLDELIDSIGVIADNATRLAGVVADTSDAGEQALSNIESTMKAADDGRNNMTAVTKSMSDMEEGMGTLEKSISNVGEAAVKINEITSTIRDIAEETNLLSLNASIEAARAGEIGRGFAVVATEIKKLAETSASAADEISNLISSVNELIEETVTQSHQSMEQIRAGATEVYSASDQFNLIFESIESTSNIIHDIISQIHDANDVAANMAAVTEEQSASAEVIGATALNVQELADIVTDNSADVKKDSTELTNMADSLKEQLAAFKIE